MNRHFVLMNLLAASAALVACGGRVASEGEDGAGADPPAAADLDDRRTGRTGGGAGIPASAEGRGPYDPGPCCAPCGRDELCLLQGASSGDQGFCTPVGDGDRCYDQLGCFEDFECQGAEINGFYAGCTGTSVGDVEGYCRRTVAYIPPSTIPMLFLFQEEPARDQCLEVLSVPSVPTTGTGLDIDGPHDVVIARLRPGASECGDDPIWSSIPEEELLDRGSGTIAIDFDRNLVSYSLHFDVDLPGTGSWRTEGSAPIRFR